MTSETPPHTSHPGAALTLVSFSTSNSICRQASASRPYGRSAVALRASLDPDAHFGMLSQDADKPKTGRRHP